MAVKRKTVAKPVEYYEDIQPQPVKKRNFKKWLILGGIVLAVVGFWWKTNSWPVVAMVGLKPVTRWEVNKKLYDQSGKALVENMIVDRLVAGEIKKQKINITDEDVEKKVVEISSQLAASNSKLEDFLEMRGQTMTDFKQQLKVQMGVEKVLDGRVTISDEEIDTYIKENGALLTSTGEAKRIEATSALKYSRYTDELAKWIEELKSKAKIWQI